MKKLLIALSAACLMFASCGIPKNCYMCITTTSVGYAVQTKDTVMKCNFTSKDANAYESAHTTNAPALTSAGQQPCSSCTTVSTNCQIPTN